MQRIKIKFILETNLYFKELPFYHDIYQKVFFTKS